MESVTLNIYDDEFKEVVKTVTGTEADLGFGTIRKLMKLLKIDDTDNTLDLLVTITDAWDEVTRLLDRVFIGVTEEEWGRVKVNELLPILVKIAKYSLKKAVSIPTEKN